jgi:hypothetical protein
VRHGLTFPIILTFALAGLYGCGDDVTDPDAFMESAEAEALMQSARDLPMLPDLMDRVAAVGGGDRAVLLRAQELWAAGSGHDARAAARRRLAVSYVLPVLSASVPVEEWVAAREGMDHWITTVEIMLQHLTMPKVDARITAARRYLERSDATEDDARRSAYYLLLAMSELVETTPRYVARSLVQDANAVVERFAATAGDQRGRDRVMERAVRLKDWAERAVVEGDYLLAIQRAYYAIQLLEGS